MAQSVQCLTLDFCSAHNLEVLKIETHRGSIIGLHAQQGICFSLSLAPPPALAVS